MERLEQFRVLDALRQAAGWAPRKWCEAAGVQWLRYLRIRVEGFTPTQGELDRFKQSLEIHTRNQARRAA